MGGITLLGRLRATGSGPVYLGVTADGRRVSVRAVPARPGQEVVRIAREPSIPPGDGIAPVIQLEADSDLVYVVSPHVEGLTLDETVARDGPLAFEELWVLAAGVAAGLRTIHDAGVVHRALGPGAVVLSPGGPVVTDFGVTASETSLTSVGLTSRGLLQPSFLAPEQVSDERVGPAADVFAWGSLVVFAATGRPAFGSGSPASVLYRLLHDEPDLDGVPEGLLGLVRRALAKSPAERPTAEQLVRELLRAAPAQWPDQRGSAGPVPRPFDPPAQGHGQQYPGYQPADPQGYGQQYPGYQPAYPPAQGYQQPSSMAWAPPRIPSPAATRPHRLVPALVTDIIVVSLAIAAASALRWFGPISTTVLVVALVTASAALLGRWWLGRPASVARWAARRGRGLLRRGRPDAALAAFQLAIDHAMGRRRLVARANLAVAHREAGNLAAARHLLEEVLPELTGELGATHPEVLTARADLAAVLRDLGRTEQAAAELRTVADSTRHALGAEHPQTLRAGANHAVALHDAGDSDSALRLLRDLLPRMERVLGRRHRDVLAVGANVAALAEPGRAAEATRQVLRRQRRELGPSHPDTLRTSTNLGYLLLRDGDEEAALALFDEVAGLARATLGGGHPLELRASRGASSVRGGYR
ncbi:tetratricopeptide repeat protein [Nonomuraea sp. PA05]|uniref:serine/threonine-protein kinase n=1 Tax=Nonomuraea sp. PA05 TaxID=2604466 RepID=UPI0011DBBE0C|nr:serine/threonine-protein kinase [Nonomuraea sp. PA05]TYB45186.1 tetratricopeptide repeat protein [Nonomuraea sp. PA05]